MNAVKICVVLFCLVAASHQFSLKNIAKKIFEKDCSDGGKWCKGDVIGTCKLPSVNRATCCFFCPIEGETTTTTTTTTTPKPLANKIVEVVGAESRTRDNDMIVVKTVTERVPFACPKTVGSVGCFIEEKCKRDFDCDADQRCCLVDCKRVCIKV